MLYSTESLLAASIVQFYAFELQFWGVVMQTVFHGISMVADYYISTGLDYVPETLAVLIHCSLFPMNNA